MPKRKKRSTQYNPRRGMAQPCAKLTDADVIAIRNEWGMLNNPRQIDLAKKYGVSQRVICKVVNRIGWKHVERHDNGTTSQQAA